MLLLEIVLVVLNASSTKKSCFSAPSQLLRTTINRNILVFFNGLSVVVIHHTGVLIQLSSAVLVSNLPVVLHGIIFKQINPSSLSSLKNASNNTSIVFMTSFMLSRKQKLSIALFRIEDTNVS